MVRITNRPFPFGSSLSRAPSGGFPCRPPCFHPKAIMEPTWQDHYDLNFWLWACLQDGEAFLESSQRSTAAMHEVSKDGIHNFGKNRARLNAERLIAQAQRQLNQYHFVLTTGSLVKTLTRLAAVVSHHPGYLRCGRAFEERRAIPPKHDRTRRYQLGCRQEGHSPWWLCSEV